MGLLDVALWYAGFLAEAAVVGLLIYRRVWRLLPVFFIFCVSGFLGDVANYLTERYFASHYSSTFFLFTLLDAILQVCVLVELIWSVLRPIRASLPRVALLVVAFVILLAGAAIWPFSGIHGLASLSPLMRNLVHIQQSTAILRILLFLLLAGCSQLLSLSLRDRELQVATGLGFYSLVSLAVNMVQSHLVMGEQFRHLNQIVSVSYLCSVLYWAFCFAQQEAERKEFTPQMQNFLLALAGVAKENRLALAASAGRKPLE